MELKQRALQFFRELQDEICSALEQFEGSVGFREDRWSHEPGDGATAEGGGVSRVLAGGKVFEKAGVNLANLSGSLSERLAARMEVSATEFYATGISLVVHPLSPMVPTVHMNLRFLQLLDASPQDTRPAAWFGGGADLTPYYLFEEDAVHFHQAWRDVCDRHDAEHYPRFKKWCDDYFFLKHRGEARGVGGIFFDHLAGDLERTFGFVQDAGRQFLPAYRPIVERRMELPWRDRQREWQLIRRGRYVEFNLVHDRGTLFGLETRGRTESILMSLPPLVRWAYDHRPEPGSPEDSLVRVLREPVDWTAARGH